MKKVGREGGYVRRLTNMSVSVVAMIISKEFAGWQVGQGGIEPPTPAFSGLRSTD
jgi:hypothetical protein